MDFRSLEEISREELIECIRTMNDWDMFLREQIGEDNYHRIVGEWCKDRLKRENPDIFKTLYPAEKEDTKS